MTLMAGKSHTTTITGVGTLRASKWEVPATEFYYIEVSGFGLATGSYTLILEPLEVTDDYPDSPDLVLPSIVPGESIEGAIDYGGTR